MIHIIGAGPAGISLAYYAYQKGVKKITLYERTNFIGGMSRSWEYNNFILDTGPHIFHTSDNEIASDWETIGKDILVSGNFNSCNILSNYPNKLFHYPLSISTLKNNLEEKEFNKIQNELKEIKKVDNSGRASSFRDFLEAKVGKTITEMFFTQYPQKVWGLKTDEMLADWAPQRISLRDEDSDFYTKPFVAVGLKGTGCFYERIIDLLTQNSEFKIYFNKNLTDINKNAEFIEDLIFNNSEKIKVDKNDQVFSTIPATSLANIFKLDLSLRFRGVRSQYFFFKNERIIPKGYNWVYCSDANVSFNRITEPSTMTPGVSPKGYSFVCVETTFGDEWEKELKKPNFEFINWLTLQPKFNAKGYIKDLYTENFERYVYPIQDKDFRTSLSKYNSLISQYKNLSVLGTGGEFHYSDMQIIFRKSKTLIDSYLQNYSLKGNSPIPLIKNFKQEKKENHSLPSKTKSIKVNQFKTSKLHEIANVPIPLIAEIGINHNGDLNLAKKMILAAKNSGAHFAKFQYYKKNSRVQKNKLTEYLHETADGIEMSLNDIFERARLNKRKCKELIKYGKEINIPVFFTVFDIESAAEIKDLDQKLVKVASMDCNNLKLHKELNSLKFENIIISTGMSNISEIKRSLSIYTNRYNILLMSCRSSYPARFRDIDFGEINFLQDETNCIVGFSDHTEGNLASLISIASGAKFIERHFTINKFLPGPDNRMSINQQESLELSQKLQIVAESLTKEQKIIHPSEQATFALQKKSLRFPSSKKKGEIIHTDDLISLAPPEGYSIFQSTLPRTNLLIIKDVAEGEPVNESNITLKSE